MSQTEILTREEVEHVPENAVPYNRPRTHSDTAVGHSNGSERVPKLPTVRLPPSLKPPKAPKEIEYPTGDNKPMADRKRHVQDMTYAINSGEIATAHLPRVWVSGNDFLYYEEGNPWAHVSPDCYIVLDVERRDRPNYKIWEEGGRVPNIVWEFTSKTTAKEDQGHKRKLYERLGVAEYILFDPDDEYLKPRLQGYRLVNGKYEPMVPDEKGHLRSEETGIVMYADGPLLRFVHPLTGETILTREEAEAHGINLLKRAEQEAARAAQQTVLAEQEAARANEEAARAERAEWELAKLREELERLRGA